jgi:hypothetical protein
MIWFPHKRIFGLIGQPRAGKDEVAKYLSDTRNFEILAFADQIKEEFGVSKEEFEAAKIAGNIEALRKKLWDFSDKIKEEDPLHFINNIINKTIGLSKSVVITDIRTQDELEKFYSLPNARVYFIIRDDIFVYKNDLLTGSKLPAKLIETYLTGETICDMRTIKNIENGVYYFHRELDDFFFKEDIKDLLHSSTEQDVVRYLGQYDIRQVRRM